MLDIAEEVRVRLIRDKLIELLPEDWSQRVDAAVGPLNSAGFDPWGLDPRTLKATLAATHWLFTTYFRVHCHGINELPAGKVMVVANHSGQMPIDAAMLSMALISKADPPRIARGMVDYWVPSLPFISDLFPRLGELVGSPQNCLDLLAGNQCVMVFPEGTRGLGKPFTRRYQLEKFGTGFLRLALEAKAPIMPVAVIGAEEAYPGLFNLRPLARLLGLPYFPITPFFPLFGALGALPIPTRITLRFGKPITFKGDPDMPDEKLMPLIEEVNGAIREEMQRGLKARGLSILTAAAITPEEQGD